jgi:hypothetical protein
MTTDTDTEAEAMRARALSRSANIVFNCDDVPPWECDRIRALLAEEIYAEAIAAHAAGHAEGAQEVVRLKQLLLEAKAFLGSRWKLTQDIEDAIRGQKP